MNNSKKKPITKRDRAESRIIESMHEVKSPHKTAIIIALIWQTILVGFAIGIYFANDYGWAGNFNTSFIIGLCLTIFWVILKWGLFEGLRLKFKNYSNKKLVEKMSIDTKKTRLSLDQYRALNKKRSWYGIYLMAAINIIGIASTLPFII